MVSHPHEVNGGCSERGRSSNAPGMTPRPPTGRPGSGAKPGATREQIERRERFERARRESLRPAGDGPVAMFGWHTVTAALKNPARRLHKLLVTENAARRLAEEGIVPAIAPEIVRPSAIAERLTPDAVHQGLYLEADPLPSPAVEDLAAQGVVLVLDQITDPHNVGAIFRSAAAFAATAIVTTQRHSPEATGALAKAASGALEVRAAGQRAEPGARARRAQAQWFSRGRARLGWRSRSCRPALARAARAGARRRGQGPAPTHQGNLRSRRAHRSARHDQEPQRVERGGAVRSTSRSRRLEQN